MKIQENVPLGVELKVEEAAVGDKMASEVDLETKK